MVWRVEIIGHTGVPDPELVDSVSHCNYFDQSRAGGGERYQTRLIMLHDVEIESGQWGASQLMTIADAAGSMGMLLSAMGDFGSNPRPQGRLNVVGIMDQEDDQAPPYTDGYRVWVKRTSDIAFAFDACRQVESAAEGERAALVNKVVSRAFDGYFHIQDPDRCGGVRVSSGRTVAPGDVVCVQGIVEGAGDACAIAANYLTITGHTDAPRPLCVGSRVLWGECGLSVDGLLVRVFGRIGADRGDGVRFFTDDFGRTMLARADGASLPAPGTAVILTAVAARSNGTPMLLVAGEDDIVVVDK